MGSTEIITQYNVAVYLKLMPQSSPDTSWLFFEEKNVSHRVREPHEWYQEGAVLLLQLRPLQRRLLRSDRSFHHPQPYSSSPGHQPPMTRFTTISIKFRRQSWIGLARAEGARCSQFNSSKASKA